MTGSAGDRGFTTESYGCPTLPKDTQCKGNMQGPEAGSPFQPSNVLVPLDTTRARATTLVGAAHRSWQDSPSVNTHNTDTEVNEISPIYPRLCSCVETTLAALEALELEAHLPNPDSIDQNLRLKKQTLVRCADVLNCEACNASSRFIVLVILLFQKVAGSYERLIRALSEQLTQDECSKGLRLRPVSMAQDHYGITRPDRKDRALFLREYETDAAEELCVYKGLITLQLSKWRILLNHVRKQCLDLDLNRHSAMVVAVDRRVEAQLQICST